MLTGREFVIRRAVPVTIVQTSRNGREPSARSIVDMGVFGSAFIVFGSVHASGHAHLHAFREAYRMTANRSNVRTGRKRN